MQLGRVIGDVVATHKDPRLGGITLLVVQPLSADGQAAGRPLVAVDSVGAGVGERVFFVRGKEASFPFFPVEVPADAGIVGIVDHWTTGEDGSDLGHAQSAGTAGDGRSAGTADAGQSAETSSDVRSAGTSSDVRSAGTSSDVRSAGTSVPASRRRR